MGQVIKRSGKKQAFSSAKIRRAIDRAAREAGLSGGKRHELAQVAKHIIEKYMKRKLIKATEIRKSILRILDRRARGAAQAWRRFDRKRR